MVFWPHYHSKFLCPELKSEINSSCSRVFSTNNHKIGHNIPSVVIYPKDFRKDKSIEITVIICALYYEVAEETVNNWRLVFFVYVTSLSEIFCVLSVFSCSKGYWSVVPAWYRHRPRFVVYLQAVHSPVSENTSTSSCSDVSQDQASKLWRSVLSESCAACQ